MYKGDEQEKTACNVHGMTDMRCCAVAQQCYIERVALTSLLTCSISLMISTSCSVASTGHADLMRRPVITRLGLPKSPAEIP